MVVLAVTASLAAWPGDGGSPPPGAPSPPHAYVVGPAAPLLLPPLPPQPLPPLLPAAHADPHTWPCVYPDRAGNRDTQTSPQVEFRSGSGAYGIGDDIVIRVHRWQGFHGSDIPHTRLLLETGDVDRFAVYTRHESNWRDVYYTYTVLCWLTPQYSESSAT